MTSCTPIPLISRYRHTHPAPSQPPSQRKTQANKLIRLKRSVFPRRRSVSQRVPQHALPPRELALQMLHCSESLSWFEASGFLRTISTGSSPASSVITWCCPVSWGDSVALVLQDGLLRVQFVDGADGGWANSKPRMWAWVVPECTACRLSGPTQTRGGASSAQPLDLDMAPGSSPDHRPPDGFRW